MRDEFGVAAFRSRQQTLRFEGVLRRMGVPAQVVSTPRGISMGCGLSVRFPTAYTAQARSALTAMNPGNLIGLYRAVHDGRRLIISGIQ